MGGRLDVLASESVRVLHDRRIPGSVANIDHIVVAPSGVYVIDAKHYTGRVEKRDKGGFFRVDDHIYVGGRDRTALVEGMAKQVATVRSAVGDGPAIIPVLCFVNGEWAMFQRPFIVNGVLVTWPRSLAKRISGPGPYGSSAAALANQLGTVLPPA